MGNKGLKWTECDGVKWTELALDRVKLQALLDMVMNLQVPQKQGIYWPADLLPTFQETPCTMELVSLLVSSNENGKETYLC